jgi:hypothetical protein
MKAAILYIVIALLIPLAFAQGQQRDSLIIEGLTIDSGYIGSFVSARIWAVTYDSVSSFMMTLGWQAPLGGVLFSPPIAYFPPLTIWADVGDSVINDSSILMYGFADLGGPPHPSIFTEGMRVNIATLRFFVMPNTSPQIVTIDTIGLLGFWNNPVFVPGEIVIRPATAIDEKATPQEFALLRNYPNPFNAQTLIQYNLPGESEVNLSIFDILGRQVATLTDGDQDAGPHQVTWNAADCPSGVYFYRLKANENIVTKRMLLLR